MRRRKSRAEIDRAGVVEAIRRAGRKLGRAPSWSELRRLTGVPESRVRVYFRSLAEAVGAAGFEPGRQGARIETEDLLRDFARVKEKLGRSPSRNEYVKLGKYSAGSFYSRFGSWGKIALSSQQSAFSQETATANLKCEDNTGLMTHHGDTDPTKPTSGLAGTPDTEARRRANEGSRELTRISRIEQRWIDADEGRESTSLAGQANPEAQHEGDKAIALRWATTVPALPGELAGKRRVTDAVCAMIVNTLLGAESDWQGQLSPFLGPGKRSTQQSAISIQPLNCMEQDRVSNPNCLAGNGRLHGALARVNDEVTSGGVLHRDRPVMGAPFHEHALSNAPVNELGVVFLFGMLAGELGFQVDSLWGAYPDCEARRQIQPGKWQRVRIEIEYESVNFARHGHDPEKCDVIVCWKHNWKNCPKHIEVIELSKIVTT